MNEAEVMEICGENGIRQMVAAFYRRVRTDDLIGPMYPENDWDGSEERLAEFLLFRLGASTRYLETRGHPKLRMRHITFRIGHRRAGPMVGVDDRRHGGNRRAGGSAGISRSVFRPGRGFHAEPGGSMIADSFSQAAHDRRSTRGS